MVGQGLLVQAVSNLRLMYWASDVMSDGMESLGQIQRSDDISDSASKSSTWQCGISRDQGELRSEASINGIIH
jgi:hypothetical protein